MKRIQEEEAEGISSMVGARSGAASGAELRPMGVAWPEMGRLASGDLRARVALEGGARPELRSEGLWESDGWHEGRGLREALPLQAEWGAQI